MTPDLANPDDRARLCAEDDAAIATFLAQHAGQYQEESPCVTTRTPKRLQVTTRTATAPPSSSGLRSASAAQSSSASSSSAAGRSGAWLLVDGFAWLVAFALLAGFVLAAERLGGI